MSPNITKKEKLEPLQSYLSNSSSISTYNEDGMYPHTALFESTSGTKSCSKVAKNSDGTGKDDNSNYNTQCADVLSKTCPSTSVLPTSVQKGGRGRRRKIKSFVATDESSIEKSRRQWNSADYKNKVRLSTYIYIIDINIDFIFFYYKYLE